MCRCHRGTDCDPGDLMEDSVQSGIQCRGTMARPSVHITGRIGLCSLPDCLLVYPVIERPVNRLHAGASPNMTRADHSVTHVVSPLGGVVINSRMLIETRGRTPASKQCGNTRVYLNLQSSDCSIYPPRGPDSKARAGGLSSES